jgi:hypothetical protein
MNQKDKTAESTGTKTERLANARPVILPPLLSILIILMIPRTNEMTVGNKLIRKVISTQPVLGFSVCGNFMATRPGKMSASPQSAQVNENMANLLIVTVTGCFDSNVSVIGALQNRQTWASSGFSLPHFGQFICINLIY